MVASEHGVHMLDQLSQYRHRRGSQVGSNTTFKFHFSG